MARFSIRGGSNGEESSNPPSRRRKRVRSVIEDVERDEEHTGNPIADNSREREEDENNDRTSVVPDHNEEDDEEGDQDDRESSDYDCDDEEASTEKRSTNCEDSSLTVILTDPDVLDCSICSDVLKAPIFQCDNGHIACSSCCTKLRQRCPYCMMPIGYYRCRAMERVVQAARTPCPNAKYGCTKKLVYGKRSFHERKCIFTLCSCPVLDCNFNGTYKHLDKHFRAEHKNLLSSIMCGTPNYFSLSSHNQMILFREEKRGLLIVVQSFMVSHGLLVSVSCISPLARGVGDFSFNLQLCIEGGKTLTFDSDMTKIQKVMRDPPVDCFMLIPSYLLLGHAVVRMSLCIRGILPT